MDEEAGRMRLILAADSRARRDAEQADLARKNAELCALPALAHPSLA